MLRPVFYDRFPTHDELTSLIRSWAQECPELVQLDNLGASREGRSIWLLTLTDTKTGPPDEKPAVLLDGNIHAAELTSSLAALHLVHHLLDHYGSDDRVTRALASRTLYVMPRINPDGAERVVRTGEYIRSSTRPYPDTKQAPGLRQCDIDGDGRVLFMRYLDPSGPWTPSSRDDRLLVRRQPDDESTSAYRLLLEGDIVGHDGATVQPAAPLEGIDLAKNFPADWSAEATSPTRFGPYPGSEPEIRSLVEFVDAHPNISTYVSCHTFGGLHLHPPLNDTDEVPALDTQIFSDLGQLGQQRTGYQVMSMHDLKFAVGQHFHGGQFGWIYDHLGILTWITELWSPQQAAGLEIEHASSWLLDHPEEDDLALLRWSDTELDGRGFVDWYPFDHPQLGPLELGGWDLVHAFYNPPLDRIESEVAPHTDWVVSLALASPLLTIRSLTAQHIAADVYKVRLVVANSGWLPTYGSAKAKNRGTAGRLLVDLIVPDDVEVLAGDRQADVGQLEGRVEARTSTTWWGHSPGTPDLALVEWTVRASAPVTLMVHAHHPRAGSVRRKIVLKS